MPTYHQKRHRRTRCPKCQQWREGNAQARRHHCGEFAGQAPAGFWKGAGIPKGTRSNKFFECGCCSAYHRTDFTGDCREDSERHYDLPDNAVIVSQEER